MRNVAKLFQSRGRAIHWSLLFTSIVLISGCGDPPSTTGTAVARTVNIRKFYIGTELGPSDRIVVGLSLRVDAELVPPLPAGKSVTYEWSGNDLVKSLETEKSSSATVEYNWKDDLGNIFGDVQEGFVRVTVTVDGEDPLTWGDVIPWTIPAGEQSTSVSIAGTSAVWKMQLLPTTMIYGGKVKESNNTISTVPLNPPTLIVNPGEQSSDWTLSFGGSYGDDEFGLGSVNIDILRRANINWYRDNWKQTMSVISRDGESDGSVEYKVNQCYIEWLDDVPSHGKQTYNASRDGVLQTNVF